MSKNIVVLTLANLVFSKKFQPREELNKEAIADYREIAASAKAAGADSPFPELKVIRRMGEDIVYSGFHRGNALKAAGYSETKCDVEENDTISDIDILLRAIHANSVNGVRLSHKDKHRNLLIAIKDKEIAALSNQAIADKIGTSEKFVRDHRPASASPTVVVSKKGKKIDKTRIGKKGGKAAKPAKSKASKKAQDKPESGKEAPSKPDEKQGLDDDAEKALRRVCAVVNGKGFDAKDVRVAVESGALALSSRDLKDWAGTSDGRINIIAPLVVNLRWKPAKALAFIDKPVDSNTKVEHLINLAIAHGGVVKSGQAFGERIEDNDNFKVIAYDHTKFDVTVTARK